MNVAGHDVAPVSSGHRPAVSIDDDLLAIPQRCRDISRCENTVYCLLQAHTFEDRVLKIDRIRIRRDATVGTASLILYGADVGARSYVAPHSVVMKRERLSPDRGYAGCPTRPGERRAW